MTILSRTLSVVAFAFVGAAVAACSSDPSSSEDTSATGASSDALTTSDAIARAEQWVSAQLQYCQSANHARDYDTACSTYCSRTANAQWDPYRSDCSELVSWAWGLPAPGRVTGEFSPFQNDITQAIPASTLKEGDAVNNADHVMLFKAWVTPGKVATFIEEPGCSPAIHWAHEFTSSVTLNGNSISVAYNGMTFTAIRYSKLTAPPPPVAPLQGAFEAASCTTISGWAQDPSSKNATLKVQLSFDAAQGKTGGEGSIDVTANTNRPDLCNTKLGGSCDHGFSVAAPLGVQDGKAHQIYAYAAPSGTGADLFLSNAPKSINCPFPTLPVGTDKAVRRKLTASAVFGAWKFSALTDVAHESAATVDAYPAGADLPATPTVVKGDDGSPQVWVVDGTARRLVPDAGALAAWHFTAATWPVAKITALAQGENWPGAPVVLEPEGTTDQYVLDGAIASPASAPGASSGGDAPAAPGSGAGGEPGPGDDGAGGPSGSSGCSASPVSSAHGSALALLLGAALLGATRRRRAR